MKILKISYCTPNGKLLTVEKSLDGKVAVLTIDLHNIFSIHIKFLTGYRSWTEPRILEIVALCYPPGNTMRDSKNLITELRRVLS